MKKLLHNSKIYKFGFTLAEVLITLVIVGVVAAFTIPTLINDTKQKQYISAWRKAYSAVSQALLLVKANGDTFDDVTTEQQYAEKVAKYMVNIKLCTSNNFVSEGCGTSYPILNLDGTSRNANMGAMLGGSTCMILADGTYLCFDAYNLVFDVNGARGPNQIGKDIFYALLDKNNFKLNPAVGYKNGWGPADGVRQMPDYGNGTCQETDGGAGCSAWYLLHDK